MKANLLLITCVLTSLGCSFLAARATESSQASTPNSAASMPRSEITGAADRTFVKQASAANLAEVKLGKLAVSQGTNSRVQSFGQRMIRDHSAANQRLNVIARSQSLAVSSILTPAAQQQYASMKGLADATFDHAYAKNAVQDLRATISLFEAEEAQGTNPALRSYAGQTLPTLKEHLSLALRLPRG